MCAQVTPFVFDIWMKILKQVPGSVLWLLPPASGFDLVRRRAKAAGVDPKRLILSHYSTDYPLHLKRCALAHLLLDTGKPDSMHCSVRLIDACFIQLHMARTRPL